MPIKCPKIREEKEEEEEDGSAGLGRSGIGKCAQPLYPFSRDGRNFSYPRLFKRKIGFLLTQISPPLHAKKKKIFLFSFIFLFSQLEGLELSELLVVGEGKVALISSLTLCLPDTLSLPTQHVLIRLSKQKQEAELPGGPFHSRSG